VKTPVVGGRRAVLEAVRAGAAAEVLVARDARSTAGLRDVLEACREAGLTVREVDRSELDGLAADHRGVAAITGSPRAIGERELAAWPFDPDDLVVVLDGITDPQNLGAAARSAEAAGATMLVTRTRRAADVTPAAIRASAGALLHLTHARIANRTVYEAERPEGRVAIVLGSEGEGLGRLTRAACDLLVRLPMRGRVGSLNASASLAAALYAFVLPRRLGGGS
jgi:23S rRNA (guanosine2251-2'-O)-methyltransferase